MYSPLLRLRMGFQNSSSPTTMPAMLWSGVTCEQDDQGARGIEEQGRTAMKGSYCGISRACHRESGQLSSLGDRK